ncbi:hypothetical protein DIPPA_34412 [Diplonema papillatum]|nr:hypothetical protein DIPPA_34412 [Diplonema papillatum]
MQARAGYEGRGQKAWSSALATEKRKNLLESLTEELGHSGQLQGQALTRAQDRIRARIQSGSGKHASAWLYGNPEADTAMWLSPAELAVAVRLRLGLPIAAAPGECRLCGHGATDVNGSHAQTCFGSGRRTRLHNALRDIVADFARRGLLGPSIERAVFANARRNRPDISYVRDGTTVLLDVAVTYPLQLSQPHYAARAAAEPGGAAAAYAVAVKERVYNAIIANEPDPREWKAVPLVVDTFGAWCPGAITELRQIARANALREEQSRAGQSRVAVRQAFTGRASCRRHQSDPQAQQARRSRRTKRRPRDSQRASWHQFKGHRQSRPRPAPPPGAAEPQGIAHVDPGPAQVLPAPEIPPAVELGAPGAEPEPQGPEGQGQAEVGGPGAALGHSALSQADLDLLTFYLDDGVSGGDLDAIARWLQGYERRAAAVGLRLNRGKCRLAIAAGAEIPDGLQGIETCSLDEIEHLGVPCGSPEKIHAFVERAAQGAERKLRMIASLPDAHVALTLTKFCAGFVGVVHLMRATGSVFDFAGVDRATQSCLATITGIQTDEAAWTQASLPVRMGGLGLHSCADVTGIAHIAAALDGGTHLPALVSEALGPRLTWQQDDTVQASLADPRLATYESVLEKIQDVMQARTQYEGRGQKVWSSALATEKRKNLLDLLTEELARSSQLQGAALSQAQDRIRARIQSSSGKHASAWLYGNPEADTGMWLSSAELAVAVRLRLGLPIAAAPGECRLCGHGATDVIGSHAQTCFGSGRRTRLHNALRDIVADFARRGLLGPSIERAVFANTRRKRPDISYVRDGTTVLLDVAVTYPLQLSQPHYATRAAAEPGGAAAAYAVAVKERVYNRIIANEPDPREWRAVPLVVDTFGAWCPGAITELRHIARANALREDRTASAACQDLFHRLSFSIAQGVARIVIASGGARPDEANPP